jgi:histidine phosphotransferase ChpT
VDVRLDLSNAPFRFLWVADKHSRLKKRRKIGHGFPAFECEDVTMPLNDLNDLIGSRICHDLISPLGAIGNGVELLSMTDAGRSPEVSLIAQSVESANARIRFFRVAFGAARPGAEIGQNEAQSIVQDCYKSGRVRVEYRVKGPQLRTDVKLAFLLLQCLDNTMPRGGLITISRNGSGWKLDARAERLKINPDLWAMLADKAPNVPLVAADVHFALVADAARMAKRQVASFLSETQATLSF